MKGAKYFKQEGAGITHGAAASRKHIRQRQGLVIAFVCKASQKLTRRDDSNDGPAQPATTLNPHGLAARNIPPKLLSNPVPLDMSQGGIIPLTSIQDAVPRTILTTSFQSCSVQLNFHLRIEMIQVKIILVMMLLLLLPIPTSLCYFQ